MKNLALILLLFAVVFSGLAIWKSDQEGAGSFANTSVTLRGETIRNKHLASARSELQQFNAFPFDFSVTTLDHQPLQKSDFAGKVLIVDIWGTWCPPCRAEIPSFVQLQERYEKAGLSILGLNYEGTSSDEIAIGAIRKFQATQSMNYPVALGNEAVKAQLPDFEGYPTTLFIDKSGLVRMKLLGAHPADVLESYALVLLTES